MKAYIITIIGATLLGAAADILSPERWRKYVSLITGFVIISCIVSPLEGIVKTDIFKGFDEYEQSADYEAAQLDAVLAELTKRVEADIEQRIKNEFGYEVSARAEIKINGDSKIEGVKKITINNLKKNTAITKRLCEVYGINAAEVEYE